MFDFVHVFGPVQYVILSWTLGWKYCSCLYMPRLRTSALLIYYIANCVSFGYYNVLVHVVHNYDFIKMRSLYIYTQFRNKNTDFDGIVSSLAGIVLWHFFPPSIPRALHLWPTAYSCTTPVAVIVSLLLVKLFPPLHSLVIYNSDPPSFSHV